MAIELFDPNQINRYPNTEIMITATQDLQKETISNKIMELQSALFFSESSSLVKLPTHIVSDVEMDAEGQVWFVIPMPAFHIDAFDKEIPAKLDFFKKGRDFFVKVKGTAYLILDAGEMESKGLSEKMLGRVKNDRMMGVKVIIKDAEVTDNSPKPAHSWLRSSRAQMSSWFF
jgi:hypothetical protein